MSYVFNDGADAPVRMAPGRHKLKITGWGAGFSQSGKAFIEADFRSPQNAKHSEKFFLTEKAFWRLDLLFKSAGLRWPKGTAIQPRAMGTLMIGRTVDVSLALGAPNATTGKQYMEIKELHPAATFEAPPIPSEDDEAPAPDNDEDVPF